MHTKMCPFSKENDKTFEIKKNSQAHGMCVVAASITANRAYAKFLCVSSFIITNHVVKLNQSMFFNGNGSQWFVACV